MNAPDMLRELIADTDAPIARTKAELRDVQQRLDRLLEERRGLELALSRRLRQPPPPPVSSDDPSEDVHDQRESWTELDRTSAIERALREAGKPLHRTAVVETLHSHGRDDPLEYVSAALAHLNRKKRAVGLGDGMWAHPDYQNADGPTSAGPSVAMDTTERSDDAASVVS